MPNETSENINITTATDGTTGVGTMDPTATPPASAADQAQAGQAQGQAASTDTNAAQKQEKDWEAAYKGLQRKYNGVIEQAKGMTNELAELKARVEELTNATTEKEQALTNTSEQAQTLAQQLAAIQAKNAMYEMVTTEFPNLAAIVRTLEPKETVEATREMLQEMSRSLEAAVQAQLGQRVPSGNMMRNATSQAPTPEQLYEKALAAAGTPEFDKLMQAYWDAAGGEQTKKQYSPPEYLK